METIRVQGTPNMYLHYDGALKEMAEVMAAQDLKNGLLVHGQKSWQVAEKWLAPLNLPIKRYAYHGECSREEVERIKERAINEQADFIMAVGGGKVIDVAKAAAVKLKIPYIIVPTLASNCAAFTPLSVFYTESGTFTDHEIFDQAAFIVALEPGLVLQTPASYFRAGIGDTLAKWYEAEPVIRQLAERPMAVDISYFAAKACHDMLLELGDEALLAVQEGNKTHAFLKVVDVIVMTSGMVGGFGEKYGRISGAHSVHNGLTVLEEVHHVLHGDKVAYGILAQLALLGEWEEIKRLIPYYQKLALPMTFTDLNVTTSVATKREEVARRATAKSESIHMLGDVTAERLTDAMEALDVFVGEEIQ